jgi:hypothetical protein
LLPIYGETERVSTKLGYIRFRRWSLLRQLHPEWSASTNAKQPAKGITMKMHQENNGFSPIAIVLETKEDAEYEMALEISDWLSNVAKL